MKCCYLPVIPYQADACPIAKSSIHLEGQHCEFTLLEVVIQEKLSLLAHGYYAAFLRDLVISHRIHWMLLSTAILPARTPTERQRLIGYLPIGSERIYCS